MTWPELILLLITYALIFYCGRVYEQVKGNRADSRKQQWLEAGDAFGFPQNKAQAVQDATKPDPHQCQSDTRVPIRPRRQSFSQIKKVLEHDHAAEKSAETVAKNTEVLSPKVTTH